jgi:drug/metabolite transporter (DMT)-like permease
MFLPIATLHRETPMAPASSNHRMGPAEWGFLLALALLWSSVFFLTKVALGDMRPFTVVVLRLGLGALVLHAVVLASGARMPTAPRTWAAFAGMGALNNVVPFCLIAWGQTQIGSGLAAILIASTPLFTVLLAHGLTTDERMTPNRLGGVLLGLVGVVVMIGPDALSGGALGGLVTHAPGHVLGQLAILGAAVSYACAGIFGRRFRALPPMVTATGQVTAGALMVLPLALLFDRPWAQPMPGLAAWAAVAAAAVFCTALGYALYFRILATAGATNLLLVTLLMPVGAVWLGMGLLGEHLHAGEVIGMALIGLGLLANDGRLLALLRPGRLPAAKPKRATP